MKQNNKDERKNMNKFSNKGKFIEILSHIDRNIVDLIKTTNLDKVEWAQFYNPFRRVLSSPRGSILKRMRDQSGRGKTSQTKTNISRSSLPLDLLR
jgi:hypothetical protein